MKFVTFCYLCAQVSLIMKKTNLVSSLAIVLAICFNIVLVKLQKSLWEMLVYKNATLTWVIKISSFIITQVFD